VFDCHAGRHVHGSAVLERRCSKSASSGLGSTFIRLLPALVFTSCNGGGIGAI
jgi:hypothetical protein